MAYAEVDAVSVGKLFDKKYASGMKTTARTVAEKALEAAFTVETPKDPQVRFWSLDLSLDLTLDAKTRELAAGCGVIVNIKQGKNKFLHVKKAPNSASGKVDPAKVTQALVDRRVDDAVSGVMESLVSKLKADSKDL